MYPKENGLSLLEILIVLGIFTIVSSAVTNLAVKSVEHQNNERTLGYQNHVFNNIQTNLKDDLNSAFSVFVSNNGSGPTKDYYVSQSCGSSIPSPVEGNTLNIVKLISYNESSNTTNFEYVRYQFVDTDSNGSTDALSRTTKNYSSAGEPKDFWPREVQTPNFPKYKGFVSFAGLAAVTPPDKVFNLPDSSYEVNEVNGKFAQIYGEEYSPHASSSWNTNCSFYVTTINLIGLNIKAIGGENKYDKAFGGKVFLNTSILSFDVNSNSKFY